MKWRIILSPPRERLLPPPKSPRQSPLYVRLLWMAAIWAGSVIALLAVAGILRLVIPR